MSTTNTNKYKIKLTYFKLTGKFYTSGEYETIKQWMFEICNEVKQMMNNKQLPGIHGNEWFVLINPEDDFPNSYPCLIIPEEYRQLIIEYQENNLNK